MFASALPRLRAITVDNEIVPAKLTGVAVGNRTWPINAFLKLVALCLKTPLMLRSHEIVI
jgi:hypothetical protein